MEITIYLSLVFLTLYVIGLIIRRIIFLRARRRMREESRWGGRIIARADEVARPGHDPRVTGYRSRDFH